MPSSATITSSEITTFVAGTRIKSAEVNSNFSIFRGHNLPVDPNTSAAATSGQYDLGSSEHRWRNIYGNPAPYVVSTTGAMSITSSHHVCLFNPAATVTASLPTAVGFYGTLVVKNIGTAGKGVVLDGSGVETIDGTATCELVDGESATLISDQTQWWRI